MKKITIACVGDSITEGWGLANFQEESYPALLQKMFPEWKFYNFGSSGTTLQSQFDQSYKLTFAFQVSQREPWDYVLLFLGANDVWQWTNEQIFKDELLHMISLYQKSKVILITPCKMRASGYEDRKLEQIRKIILEVGKEKNLPVIDLYSHSSPDWLGFDGVHPTKEGQMEIARVIGEYLKEIIKG